MNYFFSTLKQRNALLYFLTLFFIIAAIVCLVLIGVTSKQVLGINAWIKPFKFCLSSSIFVCTMAWYIAYLDNKRLIRIYSWMVTIVLLFENIYIGVQAAKGQLSHFNITSPFYGFMFSLMGIAITILTLYTAYIGFLFCIKKFPQLPATYVWGIRLGILIFVVFALEGFMMAVHLAHTVGAADGGKGLPLVNWSTKYGDLRVAHFLGMHSLQLLPLAGYYVFKRPVAVITSAIIYFIIVTLILIQALYGKPLL